MGNAESAMDDMTAAGHRTHRRSGHHECEVFDTDWMAVRRDFDHVRNTVPGTFASLTLEEQDTVDHRPGLERMTCRQTAALSGEQAMYSQQRSLSSITRAEYNVLAEKKRNDQGLHECDVLGFDSEEIDENVEDGHHKDHRYSSFPTSQKTRNRRRYVARLREDKSVAGARRLTRHEYNALVDQIRNDQGPHECEVLGFDSDEYDDNVEDEDDNEHFFPSSASEISRNPGQYRYEIIVTESGKTQDKTECWDRKEYRGRVNSSSTPSLKLANVLPGSWQTPEVSQQDYRALVERKRNDQGNHECEVFGLQSGGMEGGSEWRECSKKDQHYNFIPVEDFRLENLPQSWRGQENLDVVKRLANITVRLRVGYTSEHRPDGYIFSSVRGLSIQHSGSGWIYSVSCREEKPCDCHECDTNRSVTPPEVTYEILVVTACHVVYNTEEAKSTRVDLFYDAESSMREGKVHTVWGYDVMENDPINDMCTFRCVTHDPDLGKRLKTMYDSECPRRKTGPVTNRYLDNSPDDHCVVVSHPHGLSKHVTVGKLRPGTSPGCGEAVVYTAHTCPGSSGGPVYRSDPHNSYLSAWIHRGTTQVEPCDRRGFSTRGFPTMLL